MAPLPVTESEHAHMPPTKPAATTAWGLFRGASVVAVVLLLVGALAWFVFGIGTGIFVDSDAKRVVERQKILADRNTEDYKLLHDPASVLDKDKGILRVPLDEAIKMTIADLQRTQQSEQPHPAYPLTQSPPQPANAPTSPDKGAATANAATNPSASNPTVAQPSPAPVAAAPTPAPATSASNPPVAPSPAASAAPSPAPAATAVPAATPTGVAAPSADNNANNPGNPPVPGTSAQPAAAPAASVVPTPTPDAPPAAASPAGTP